MLLFNAREKYAPTLPRTLLVVGVAFLDVGVIVIIVVEKNVVLVLIVGAEDVIDLRLVKIGVIDANQLGFPVQGLIGDKAQHVKETVKISVGAQFEGLGRNLDDGG